MNLINVDILRISHIRRSLGVLHPSGCAAERGLCGTTRVLKQRVLGVCMHAPVRFCTIQSCQIDAQVVASFVRNAAQSTVVIKQITSLSTPSFAVRSFVFLCTSCTTEHATTCASTTFPVRFTSSVNTATTNLPECQVFAKTLRVVRKH